MAQRRRNRDELLDQLAVKIMQEPDFNDKIRYQVTLLVNDIAKEIVPKHLSDSLSEQDLRALAKLVAQEVVVEQLMSDEHMQKLAKNEFIKDSIKNELKDHMHDDRFKDPITQQILWVLGHIEAHEKLEKYMDGRVQHVLQNHVRFWLPVVVSVLSLLVAGLSAYFTSQAAR